MPRAPRPRASIGEAWRHTREGDLCESKKNKYQNGRSQWVLGAGKFAAERGRRRCGAVGAKSARPAALGQHNGANARPRALLFFQESRWWPRAGTGARGGEGGRRRRDGSAAGLQAQSGMAIGAGRFIKALPRDFTAG